MGTDWLYGVARSVVGISGIKAVHCGDGNSDFGIRPIPASLPATPALVIWEGEEGPSANGQGWERHPVAPEISIYVAREADLGKAFELCRSFKRPVEAAVRARAKAYGLLERIEIGSWSRIEAEQWQPGDGKPWYFVTRLTCDGRLQLAATHIAA